MKKKNIRIVASYESDLGLVLRWLRLKKVISSASSPYETKNKTYAVRVASRVSKKDLSDIVKDRFGIFAKVV
tara:strand:- start:361 stop:576 length:216 start_codon:yes stop_codon:yes gene_type:complete